LLIADFARALLLLSYTEAADNTTAKTITTSTTMVIGTVEGCGLGLTEVSVGVGVITGVRVGLTGVGVRVTVGVAEVGVGVRFGIGIWLIEVGAGVIEELGVGVGITTEVGAKTMEDGSVTVSTRYA